MSQFWIKQTADAPTYGPFTGAQLKTFAAERRIAPTSLVSPDQTTWHVAHTVKGLFPAQPEPAQTAPVASAPTPHMPPVPQSTSAQPIPYRTPGAVITQTELTRRGVGAFAFVAGLLAVAYVFTLCATWVLESTVGTVLGVATFFLLLIPALILWINWVHAAHKDLRFLTNGAYRITPGQAVGLSFVPIFDAFWVVYMPYKLATELNVHLAARKQALIPTGTVMTCQIASVVVAIPLPLLTPVMYAISMWLVQSGFNRLAGAPATTTSASNPHYAAIQPA